MLCCKGRVQAEEREEHLRISQEHVIQDEDMTDMGSDSEDEPVNEDLGYYGVEESMLMSM